MADSRLIYMLFLMACKIALLFGNSVNFGRFGMEGLIMVLCMFLYTMLYYWFKAFTPRLHPLLQIIIPYIPYALMVYLESQSAQPVAPYLPSSALLGPNDYP